MDFLSIIVPAVFVLIVGRFLYGRVKYGSWTGAFLKGRIAQTVGEVTLASPFATTQKIRVHAMQTDDRPDPFVALVVTAKAPMGASMQPYKLSKTQALELADYLTKAARNVA